jgi:mevalonate kinase
MIKNSLYYAKILLFGEYGIIEDAQGLSIPYDNYNARFSFDHSGTKAAKDSNQKLKAYALHLQDSLRAGNLTVAVDTERMMTDIEKGMHFDSSIPQGYGVGSSGALVAATYAQYAIRPIRAENDHTPEQLQQLKSELAALECYFHGRSSGMDPLICYLQIPILFNGKRNLGAVQLPQEQQGEGAIFLLNTGEAGETQPLVNLFMERLKQDGFRRMVRTEFRKYNNACIKSFLKGDVQPLFRNLRKLSQLALDNFKPMIPSLFHQLWKQGIETEAYYLKLCGSGGGGYILGFTRDFDRTQKLLSSYDLKVVYRF